MPTNIFPWLLLAVQLTLSTLLIIAFTGKVLESEEFAAALRLSYVPNTLVDLLRVIVPTFELGLALALLLSIPRSLEVAMGATVVLFLAFTLWMVWVLARRVHVHCGCFGATGAQVSWWSVIRNLLLLLMAGGGVVLAAEVSSVLPGPSLWMVVAASCGALCIALIVGFQAARPSLFVTLHQLAVLNHSGMSREGRR